MVVVIYGSILLVGVYSLASFFPVPASSTCKYLLLLPVLLGGQAGPQATGPENGREGLSRPLPGQLPLSLAGALSNMS